MSITVLLACLRYFLKCFLVLEAVVDNYTSILMLHIGGAQMLPFALWPSLPLRPPPKITLQRRFMDTARNLSVATNNRKATAAGNVKLSSTTASIFHLSTVGHGSEPDQQQPPFLMPERQTTYIVGPVIYMYFTTANNSDARFTVDLLFQHPSYFKASLSCILFDKASYR